MGWETVTTWHRSAEGWARSVWSNVRVEVSQALSNSAVGPVPGGATKAFFFSAPELAPGDCLMVGVGTGAEPPDDALTIERVDPYSMRSAHHHTEVTAR